MTVAEVSFEVLGSDVRRALVIDIISQLRDKRVLDDKVTAGLDAQLVDHLMNGLRLPELIILSDYRNPLFRVQIDQAEMLRQLELARRRNGDEATLEYLIRNGATKELVAKWFSLTRHEVIALRKTFHDIPRSPGKPRLPDTRMRDAIHAAWATIPADLAERDRYLALHQNFPTMTIAALYRVVHEHDAAQPARSPSGSVGSRKR
jgi:hypothetical protein